MTGRFENDARREGDLQDGFRFWREECVTLIHAHVSAYDVLQRNGIKLRYGGNRAESIFCPFHGNTRTMAARYHAADARSSDHVWCFACNPKRPWDAITLYGKFVEYQGKFTGLLRTIARDYGITLPEVPTGGVPEDPAKLEMAEAALELDVCERLLKSAKEAFDMKSYLILGSVLDKLAHGLDAGTQPLPKALDTMAMVRTKIGERVRDFVPSADNWSSCPVPVAAEATPLIFMASAKSK